MGGGGGGGCSAAISGDVYWRGVVTRQYNFPARIVATDNNIPGRPFSKNFPIAQPLPPPPIPTLTTNIHSTPKFSDLKDNFMDSR